MANYMQFNLARDTAIKYVRRSVRVSPEDAFKISLLDFVEQRMVNRLHYYLLSEMKELTHLELFLQEASDAYMTELLEKKDLAEASETEVCIANIWSSSQKTFVLLWCPLLRVFLWLPNRALQQHLVYSDLFIGIRLDILSEESFTQTGCLSDGDF